LFSGFGFVRAREPMKNMRILIQKKDSGQYFKDIETWTPNSSEAMDFLSSTAAIEFCTMNKIKGVHLVLKFEDEHHEIVMPVVKERSHRTGETGQTV
jgi:hypothetical protein